MLFKTAKNIEEFKENEKQTRILLVLLLLLSISGIYLCIRFEKNSYQFGFFVGLFFAMAFYLIKSIRLSKNEDKLKKSFINTYDERNILILQQSSHKTVVISIVGIGMASLFCSIFNTEIAIALGLTCVSIALVLLITSIFEKNKN